MKKLIILMLGMILLVIPIVFAEWNLLNQTFENDYKFPTQAPKFERVNDGGDGSRWAIINQTSNNTGLAPDEGVQMAYMGNFGAVASTLTHNFTSTQTGEFSVEFAAYTNLSNARVLDLCLTPNQDGNSPSRKPRAYAGPYQNFQK